ncbi:MAG: tetratricopeptide repeat protein [Candidatus Omnitrophica bacterium]|nr:tetratricopeptide repeat protein [Candidatus Omnitrophota bacterium]
MNSRWTLWINAVVSMGLSVAIGSGCAHAPLRSPQGSRRVSYGPYMRGLMLERSAHLSDALDAYRQALEHDEDSPFLHVRVGATQVKLGQTHQALKSFQRALSLDPSDPDALRWMAMLLTSQGQIDEAIRLYERLSGQEPADRFVLSTLADLYVLQGRLDDAVKMYTRLIDLEGPSQQLYFNLGVLYGRLGQFPNAIEHLSRAMELVPDSVEVRVALGLTYELAGQLSQAAAHYEEAIRLDPLNNRLYHHAARVAANQQDVPKAIRHYEMVLDIDPNDLEAIVGLVRLWMAEAQYVEAQHVLAAKLNSLGQLPELYLLLGLVYREADIPLEALRAFERASELRDDAPQAHFYLGAQLERLERNEEARWELRRAIELDPNHADALNYLGYMDADDGVNLREAKVLIERALALDPDNGAYLDSLGWVFYRLGQVSDAIRHLERASRLVDDDATVFDHLGQAYFAQGEAARAEIAWRKAIELDPDFEDVKRRLEQLMQRQVTVP